MNPFLPLTEYIPDGELHVFGDRVYLYGSHDAPRSERFCVRDYVVWSAPVTDLSNWTCSGTAYRREQDPRSKPGKPVDFYAPDCVRGNDGKYYLYYCAMGPNTRNFGPISAAASEAPDGPFSYLGDIRYPDGAPVLKYLNNDPSVLNDNGRIWLYYGWGLGRDFRSRIFAPIYNTVLSRLSARSGEEVKATKPSILSCAVVELEDDMLTVKTEPKAVLDSKTTAPRNSEFYHHAFYEAPSIRKIGSIYYLIYSSGENNELAYAASRYPDRDFVYRGVIISNSDLGYEGNKVPKAPAGTIHGSIENINGRWYVFYHRCTNNTDFSRQACAEPISILPDGTISQVEITTQGISDAPIPAEGTIPAAYCCNIIPEKSIKLGLGRQQTLPRVTEEGGTVFAADVSDGTTLGYKYFRFHGPARFTLEYRGSAQGTWEICAGDVRVGAIKTEPTAEWTSRSIRAEFPEKDAALYLTYRGTGKCDLLSITFSEESER